MTLSKEIKIAEAKGRPMLTWVGKKPPRHVIAYPAQLVEAFDPAMTFAQAMVDPVWQDWPNSYPKGGLLFHGDNKEVLAHLLANGFRGKVKLIYIDPPFDSGADYVRKVQLRGISGMAKIDGETYTLGEQIQYTDIWANDNYLQFMYERLLLLRELLAEDGSIYLHCDPSRNSYIRLLLDEVFGPGGFVNEIVWQRLSAHNDAKRYGIIHDTIYYYTKSEDRVWNPQSVPFSDKYIEQFFDQTEEGTGRRYSRSDLTARGLRNGETGKPWRGINPGEKGNHWKVAVAQLEEWDREGRIHWPKSEGGMPRLKRYLDDVLSTGGGSPQDIWTDIKPIHNQSSELLDYPTQKPESLIERIVQTSSNPGDIVLDAFVGSGTTAAVAQRLGRRWIGCDLNKGAIQTTSKRVQQVILEQCRSGHQTTLDKKAPPASLGLAAYRVNNYDLQVQHNEAVNLACEHIGVERSRSDSFFDGTLGNRLVKVIPFHHPLTPIDLEELKRELDSRPDEDRGVVLVCLGKELAADAWLEEWNRLRSGKNAVNRIEVIELRTDPKYGRFIAHEPATADVSITRDGNEVTVEITDFISPSIVKRLDLDNTIFKAKITDWRSMVDCVMIDTCYNEEVFRVTLSDVPATKDDFVQGRYKVDAPGPEATVAVKIIDMLGEEIIVTGRV